MKTAKKIILIITIILLVGIIFLFLKFTGAHKILLVKKYTNLNALEKTLCKASFQRELIRVGKCSFGQEIIYFQDMATDQVADSDVSIYLDQNGQKICSSGWPSDDECAVQFKKRGIEFDHIYECEQQVICSNWQWR